MNRKLICLLIAMVMVFTCIPTGLFAEGEDVVTEDSLASLIKNAITESAPAIETVEEPEEAVEEEFEEETVDLVVEEVQEEKQEETPVVPEEEREQVPAEDTVTEEPVEEVKEETTAPVAEEVQEEAEVPAADDAEETFVAGLAYLSSGKVFADKQLTDEIGSVDQKAIVYANARMTGEGELANDDIIEIIANIENQLKTLYVKNERLTYFDEVQAGDYQTAEHTEGIDYLGTKLDAIAFTSAEMETESEPAETSATVEEIVPEENVEDSEVIIVNEAEKEPVDSEKDNQDVKSIIKRILSQNSGPTVITEPDRTNEDAVVETVVDTDEETELIETAAEPIEDVTVVEETVETVEVENADAATGEEVEIDDIDEIVEVESAEAGSAVVITKQPEDVSAKVGETVTFTVVAENAETYQWQYSNDNGESWGNCGASLYEGVKTDTITVQFSRNRIGWLYRCVVTGGGKTETSEGARLSENVGVVITQQPEDASAKVGETVTFTVVAENAETYQWQYSNNDGESWGNCGASLYEGVKTDTITVQFNRNRIGWLYRCVVTGGGQTVESNGAVLSLDANIIVDGVTYAPITTTTCKVISYAGTASTLTIPETVEGMTVTEIGEQAFMNNTILVSIDLPDTITIIRARAFKGCINLSEMH